MKRRAFLAGLATTAAGLVLPYEPKRIYSFPSRLTEIDEDVEYFRKKLFDALDIPEAFRVPMTDFSTAKIVRVMQTARQLDLLKKCREEMFKLNPLARSEDFWIPKTA